MIIRDDQSIIIRDVQSMSKMMIPCWADANTMLYAVYAHTAQHHANTTDADVIKSNTVQ